MSRLVAIVGRPNVGKSTLFNRLTGERAAIVDDQSGVTRDRIYGTCEWEGRHFSVVDTGGFVAKPEATFEAEIRQQVDYAIEEASLILFMVDVRTGITKEDELFAKILMKTKKPVLVVANKSDNANFEYYSYEFYQLGFHEIYPISSNNGSGSPDLLDEVYNKLNLGQLEEEETNVPGIPKFAILGRPNTGKSTLVNALIGEDRNIVSDIPGTTRDAINNRFTKFNKQFEIVDTAGLRKRKRVNEELEHISNSRAIRAMEKADVCFIMIDAHMGLEKQDINIINRAIERKKGIVILINKWDDVEKDDKTHLDYIDHIQNRLNLPINIPVHFISALEKTRLLKAFEEGMTVYDNLHQHFTTSKLNEVMLPAIKKNPPPSDYGKPIQIKYVTQLHSRGIAIAFFCNNPLAIKAPYKKYLERKLREHFNLKGVPISLVFRSK